MQCENAENLPLTCAVLTTLYRSDDISQWNAALDSVLEQKKDGLDVRIYLCIDGPIPESHEDALFQRRGDLHLVLQNEKNLGLAESLNRLISVLESEDFVFRMDGDDLSLPGRFRAQIAWLQEHTGVDLVGCQAMDIDDRGLPLQQRSYPVDAQTAKNLLTRQNPVLHPTFCMRRSLLKDPAIRYPKAYLTEDLAFLVLMAERGYAFGNIPERLFQWRTGSAFFKRRSSLRRAFAELLWYGRAVWAVKGPLSSHWAFPLIRFALRCLPTGMIQSIYKTGMRERMARGV